MEFTYGHGDRPVPGYTIMRAVGRGGFGEVYFAVSDGGREVALKRLVENAEIELRGVKRCINIKSPHLVSVFDIVTGDDGRPYVIMEYIAGPSLRDLLSEHPQGLGREQTLHVFRGIAAALACLHDHSIVHRDLKPENIFLDEGYVKIGDYGLAKHISVSQPGRQTINLGTVHYMAPEIATGRYDHRVDIYALGVVLYEMLTGQPPFTGNDMYEIALKHAASAVDPRSLPSAYRRVVMTALAKDPAERYDSVQGMGRDVSVQDPARPQPNRVPAPSRSRALPRLTVLSGEGRFGRLCMMVIAALCMAFAVSLASSATVVDARPAARAASAVAVPSFDALLGSVFLPTLLVLIAGSIYAGSIGLWFYNRSHARSCSGLVCRSMVAAGVTGMWACAFSAAYHGGHPMARHSEELLLALLVGLALVNWYGVATPRRSVRVSLSQAVIAALLGWVGCLVADVESFMPIGLLGGMAICVGFLCPMTEDLSEERQAVRTRPPRHAERGTPVECTRTTAERSPSAGEMKRRRLSRWWWVLIPLLFLLLKFSTMVVVAIIVGTVAAIREIVKAGGTVLPGGVRQKDPFGVEAL